MLRLLGILLIGLLVPSAAGAATITEFDAGAGSAPRYITPGPDGSLWFADAGTTPGVGRITTGGRRLPTIPDAGRPVDIHVAPDGAAYWTTDAGITRRGPDGALVARSVGPSYGIGMTAAGLLRYGRGVMGAGIVCAAPADAAFAVAVEQCETPVVRAGRITDLTVGPEGWLWGAWYESNQIRRVGETGLGSELPFDLPPGSGPSRIALGPDRNLWVTMFDAGAVDRVTAAAERTRFPLPPGSGPNDIAVGPDGALWITDFKRGRILRMRTDGVVTEDLAIPTPGSQPIGITAGPDGALWFTESATSRIGRVSLTGPAGVQQGGGGGGGDAVAPRFLRGLSFSPARFRVRRGSEIRFELSEAASVRITIARPASGRRVDGRCVAPTRRNRRRSRCTRHVTVGSSNRGGRQGANAITFDGRVNGRALAARSYRATAVATDPAGNASAPSRTTFTIARR